MRELLAKMSFVYVLLCVASCNGDPPSPSFNAVGSARDVRVLLREKVADGRMASAYARTITSDLYPDVLKKSPPRQKISLIWIEVGEDSGRVSKLVWQVIIEGDSASVATPCVANGPRGVLGIAFFEPDLGIRFFEVDCDGSLEPMLPWKPVVQAYRMDRPDVAKMGYIWPSPLFQIMSREDFASAKLRQKIAVRTCAFTDDRWSIQLEIDGRFVQLERDKTRAVWELVK